MGQYNELIGSFIRTGNFPIEADYIFKSLEDLQNYYQDPVHKATLHKGLLRFVEQDEDNVQSLYWVIEGENGLEFQKLIKNLDIDHINTDLDTLLQKINQEIQDRKNTDEQIYGTSDITTINPDLDSIFDLATALTNLKSYVESIDNETTSKDNLLTEQLKATVGTEDDDIIEYLKTLDYQNLTQVSESLHHFLDTIDTTNTSINTLPELKEFLRGFEYTHNLYECFVDFWNNIQGSPTPNTQFRTLRGIQDFIQALASSTSNKNSNLQSELDQTQIGVGLSGDGSYNPDKETYYLKDATSVMNALKTLDSLMHQSLQEFVLHPDNKDIIPIDINKTPNGYTIGAQILLSNSNGNQLIKKSDGLYNNVHLEYDNGLITLYVNDSIISQFNITISSILKDGYYNPDTEEIVLQFNTQDGQGQIVRIPVGSLIREWEPDNSISNKVIELHREQVIGGTDKLSADVRISEKAYNILQKDGNSLYVDGTSDSVTYNGQTLTSVLLDIQDKSNSTLESLTEEISNRKENDSNIRSEITEKISELNTKIIQESSDRETSDNDIKNLISTNSNNITNVSKQIDTVQSNLEIEIQDRKNSVQILKDDIEREIDKIDININNLDNKLDTVTIVKQDVAEVGFADTYYLSINGIQSGMKINVPEDKVVKQVLIKEVTELNVPYQGAQIGDKYIEFSFYGEVDNLYLPVSDLIINYKEGDGITIRNNVISSKIFINDRYLENGIEGIKTKGIDEAINTSKQELINLLDNKAPINSPIFTGIPQVEQSPDPTDSSQRIPSTNWVVARIKEAPFISPESYWLILT